MAEPQLDDFLAHYGVKGMKWGVRKDRDGDGKVETTRAEKKAARTRVRQAKREKRAKKVDIKISEMKTKVSELEQISNTSKNPFRRAFAVKDRKNLLKDILQSQKDAKNIREGKFTDTERKLLIGGAVVASLATAYGIYTGIESGDFRQMAAKGKAALQLRDHVDFKENKALADKSLGVDQIYDQVVKKINPEYGKIGTKMNCRRATMAYEMRRRGFDVMATRTTTAYGQTAIGMENVLRRRGKSELELDPQKLIQKGFVEEALKGMGLKKTTPHADMTDKLMDITRSAWGDQRVWSRETEGNGTASGILSALQKLPNGARGELGMQWGMGGGHSMAWEIINGVPTIFDNQNGKVYRTGAQINELQDLIAEAAITRLDNAQLNEDFLLRWLKDVG